VPFSDACNEIILESRRHYTAAWVPSLTLNSSTLSVLLDELPALMQDTLAGVLVFAGPGAVQDVAEGAVPPLAYGVVRPFDDGSVGDEANPTLCDGRGLDPAVVVDVGEVLLVHAKRRGRARVAAVLVLARVAVDGEEDGLEAKLFALFLHF